MSSFRNRKLFIASWELISMWQWEEQVEYTHFQAFLKYSSICWMEPNGPSKILRQFFTLTNWKWGCSQPSQHWAWLIYAKMLKFFQLWDSFIGVSLVAQMVKSLPTMQEIWVRSLGQEDPLEEGMATHSGILAWRIPWIEKFSILNSI